MDTHLTYNNSFPAHNNLMKEVLVYLFQTVKKPSASEKLRNLPEVTQLERGKPGICTGVACLQSPCHELVCYKICGYGGN